MKTNKRPTYPRINFRCPPQLLAKIEARAAATGLRTSELVRSIIHQHLQTAGGAK
jgi:predicted DNA binding CopG/RHH family protein